MLQDVRVGRDADVGSDHQLVTANLNLKLRGKGPGKARQQQFDVKKVKEPRAKRTFTLQLNNKFQARADAEKTYTARHERHQHHLGADQSVLYTGCRQKKRKVWITANTWQAIESRNALKKRVVALHEPIASPSQPRVTSQPRVNHESSQFFLFCPEKNI